MIEIESIPFTERTNNKFIKSEYRFFGRCYCCNKAFGIKISEIPMKKRLYQYGCFDVESKYPLHLVCIDNCINCKKINTEKQSEQTEIEDYVLNEMFSFINTNRIWFIYNPTSQISKNIVKKLINFRKEEKLVINFAYVDGHNDQELLFDLQSFSEKGITPFPLIDSDVISLPPCLFE